MQINKHNFFKSIQVLVSELNLAENFLKVAFSLSHSKKIEARLEKALIEIKRVQQSPFKSAASIQELVLKLKQLYGKLYDLFIQAKLDQFYFNAYKCAPLPSRRKKLLTSIRAFLKNHRLSTKENSRIVQILSLIDPKRNALLPFSLEPSEVETLLETVYYLYNKNPEAMPLFLSLSPQVKERFVHNLKALKEKDMFSAPKKSALALMRVYTSDQGLNMATPEDLKMFIQERKAIQEIRFTPVWKKTAPVVPGA